MGNSLGNGLKVTQPVKKNAKKLTAIIFIIRDRCKTSQVNIFSLFENQIFLFLALNNVFDSGF